MSLSQKEIKLIRHDLINIKTLHSDAGSKIAGDSIDEYTELLRNSKIWPSDRDACIRQFGLPRDSIIKVYYEGHLIPWSLLPRCPSVEIRVFRPNQNVIPKNSTNEATGTEDLILEKVSRLETRISSLETVVDPDTIQLKNERDLQLLTKQISFLSRRFGEADQTEWIKKT